MLDWKRRLMLFLLPLLAALPLWGVYHSIQSGAPEGYSWQGNLSANRCDDDEQCFYHWLSFYDCGGRFPSAVEGTQTFVPVGSKIFSLLGQPAYWLHIDLMPYFWTLRMLFGLFFALAAFRCLYVLFPDAWEKSWLLLVLGSGLGWLLFVLLKDVAGGRIFGGGTEGYTHDMTEGNSGYFSSMIFRPYYMGAYGVFLLGLSFLSQALGRLSPGRFLLGGALLTLSLYFHAINGGYCVLAAGLFLLLSWPQLRRMPLWVLLMTGVLLLAGTAHVFINMRQGTAALPVEKIFAVYNTPIRPLAYLMTFGLSILVAMGAGLWRLRSGAARPLQSALSRAAFQAAAVFFLGVLSLELWTTWTPDGDPIFFGIKIWKDNLYILIVLTALCVGGSSTLRGVRKGRPFLLEEERGETWLLLAFLFFSMASLNGMRGFAAHLFPRRMTNVLAILGMLLAGVELHRAFASKVARLGLLFAMLLLTMPSAALLYQQIAGSSVGYTETGLNRICAAHPTDGTVTVIEPDEASYLWPYGRRLVLATGYGYWQTSKRKERYQALDEFLSNTTAPEQRKALIKEYHLGWLLWDDKNPHQRDFDPARLMPDFLTLTARDGHWALYQVKLPDEK